MPELPKELQKEIMDFQSLQKQLELILLQKQQLMMQSSETNNALDELKNVSGKVYKAAGSIMFETNKTDLEKELKEKKESLDSKLSILGKQEEKFRSKLKDSQTNLQEKLKPHMEASGG